MYYLETISVNSKFNQILKMKDYKMKYLSVGLLVFYEVYLC